MKKIGFLAPDILIPLVSLTSGMWFRVCNAGVDEKIILI